MEDNKYFDLVETIFNDIEDRVDELPFDLDIDVSGGLLSVMFPDGSSVVLSNR